MISNVGGTSFSIIVFVFTYLGMAFGRVPGLLLDRAGIALLAVTALLVSGVIDVTGIGQAIDISTLLILFALMILSGHFAQSGFYDVCARTITRANASPAALLFFTVAMSGALSTVLANDIVVFAMAPILCRGIATRGLDPRPFLIGLAGGANAGSAATLIGNPQNILIGQVVGLDFWNFIAVCGIPSLASMVVIYLTIRIVWRRELGLAQIISVPVPSEIAVNYWQITKGLVVTIALIALFVTPLPRDIVALALAGVLLASRRIASRDMIAAVDWHLLLLIACLFVVTAAFASTGIAIDAITWLEQHGFLVESLTVMAPLALTLSNTIGNVPAVILLTSVWPQMPEGAALGLALLSTLAGNLLLVGSLANIIVAERARCIGIHLGFADFARAGVPMTLISITMAIAWLALGGWMPL